MKLILYSDGAARGNPGPSAIGVVLTDGLGAEIAALGDVIPNTTNNEAEYRALLRGLDLALEHHADELEIRVDSELLARQLQGSYRVRAADLKPLYEHVQRQLRRLGRFSIRHIPREQNHRADALANEALDRRNGGSAPRGMIG